MHPSVAMAFSTSNVILEYIKRNSRGHDLLHLEQDFFNSHQTIKMVLIRHSDNQIVIICDSHHKQYKMQTKNISYDLQQLYNLQ